MDDDEAKGAGTKPEEFAPPWAYRGKDISRVLALSDGIFAFAMTLLVLGLALPAYASGKGVDHYIFSGTFIAALYSYVITFFVIALWWQAHHLIFSYIRAYDRPLIQINSAFLILIAVLPFATDVLNAAGSARVGVILFALIQVATGITLLGLWVYATGRSHLVPSHIPKDWTESIRVQMLTAPVVFACSIPLAFINASDAELVWVALFVIIIVRRRKGKAHPAEERATPLSKSP
jgi:uncharacterized membrane protein